MPLSETQRAYKREYRLRRIAADPSYNAVLAAAALRYKDRMRAENPELSKARERAAGEARKAKPDYRIKLACQGLRQRYGVTLADKQAMFDQQGGRCAIGGCGHEFASLSDAALDHDHDSGKVRELLCNSCNKALGFGQDNAARLRALADYLDKHK